MGEFVGASSAFNDLRDFGADDIPDDFLDWRWDAGVASDGAVVGIPTDVGGMAIAYRTDLFAAAGLPTDRAKVAALFADWDGYIATGKKYVAATDKPFVDSGKASSGPYRTSRDRSTTTGTATSSTRTTPRSGTPGTTASRRSRPAFRQTSRHFRPDGSRPWPTAVTPTLPAPAWMLGTIEQQAPDTAGKWDIATLPGVAGNDGGSFLAVPEAPKNAQAAYDFITWLEAPEQQLALFEATNTFPSTPSVYDDPRSPA